jgi:hypothetical protein
MLIPIAVLLALTVVQVHVGILALNQAIQVVQDFLGFRVGVVC